MPCLGQVRTRFSTTPITSRTQFRANQRSHHCACVRHNVQYSLRLFSFERIQKSTQYIYNCTYGLKHCSATFAQRFLSNLKPTKESKSAKQLLKRFFISSSCEKLKHSEITAFFIVFLVAVTEIPVTHDNTTYIFLGK